MMDGSRQAAQGQHRMGVCVCQGGAKGGRGTFVLGSIGVELTDLCGCVTDTSGSPRTLGDRKPKGK